ncbi:MAG TPA: hypothetical protein VMB18_07055 [Terriglobales bacterium]|nr:hypothetical protein [Terriglobales bacterium]
MMINLRRRFFPIFLSVLLLLCGSAWAQDQPPADGSDQNLSVADQARKARKDSTKEIQMSDADAKKLFESVNKIFAFASEDTGFPQHADVKRRLVGSDEVEKYTRQQQAKQDYAQRFSRSELTMKKLGLLPRDFNMREFLVKANGKQIGAYYDFDTKTISMLNWIPLEQQAPILAHELTHALQDQNYGLKNWLKTPDDPNPSQLHSSEEDANDDRPTARRAVVEGQAQVVFVDYILQPTGKTLQAAPGLLYQMEDPAVKAVADSELLHDAPMIIREMGTFPYVAGLIFEGELLQKGGKPLAFAGAFARPPRTTHEVLHPDAYLAHEKPPTVALPDVQSLLGNQYSIYDSGGIGELDMRALLKQYGERKAANDIAADWVGGRYVAFRKANPGAASEGTVSDLALLFVSRWKSAQSAQHFAKIYVGDVNQRYANAAAQPLPACGGTQCPVAAASFSTDEGPVLINDYSDNTVVICEGFDQGSAAKLLTALRNQSANVQAATFSQDELGLRLFDAPGFAAFQERIEGLFREELIRRASKP